MPKKGYKQCPACAEWIREKAGICRFCGAVLTDQPLPEFVPEERRELDRDLIDGVEERFSLMGLHLSLTQQRRIVDFLKHSGEEYRLATSLFVDICGFTRICEQVSGEQIKDILDLFYMIFSQVVDFYNGLIVQIAGDGGVAVFGAPRACDRDAEAAVRAAQEIRARIRALPPIHGVHFQVAIGLATGEVLSSVTWAHHPPIYKVYGSSINLASRIEESAEPDSILIDSVTNELTEGVFQFRTLPPREFKNVAEPVQTFELLGEEATAVGRRDNTVLYVGREAERGKGDALWKQFLAAGELSGQKEKVHPGLAIYGEPGIGKSRFLLEFINSHRDESSVLTVECEPFTRKTPFGLWRGAVASLWKTNGAAQKQGLREELDSTLSGLGFPREQRTSFHAIFGFREGIKIFQGLPPAIAGKQVAADLRRLLERIAAERPLILALDDLQWADPTSLDILGLLLSSPSPHGVFFLLAYRPEAEFEIPGGEALESIHLQPLNETDRATLFNLLADTREFYPEIRDALLERAEGNPFYLIELVRTLRRNIEEQRDSRAGRSLPSAMRDWIPHSLQELIQARIDRLDDRRRLVLQCGSVLGRRFAYQIVELFDMIREGLLARLYSLKALDYLDDLLLPEGVEFLFRHDLTREVAYHSLLERRRVEFHRLIAERIEERFADRLDEFYALLAFHFSRSDRNEKAIEYLHRAGDRAAAMGAVPEARECYEEALVRLARMCPTAESRMRQTAILVAKGRLHRFQGEQESAMRALQTALPIAEDLNARRELARIHTEIGLAALLSADHREAEVSLSSALKRARRLGDPSLLGMIYNGLGICSWTRGDFKKASARFAKTAALDLRKTNPKLAADALNNLALIAWKTGTLPKARTAFVDSRKLYAKAGDRFGVSATTMNLGIIEENLGRYKMAERLYRQALETAESISYAPALTAIYANLASLALDRDQFDEAMTQSARAAEIAERIHDRRSEAIALENLALALLHLGQNDEAHGRIVQARDTARAIGDRERTLSLNLAEIEILLTEGTADGCLERLKKAAKEVDHEGFEAERPRLYRLMAWAESLAPRNGNARKTAERAAREAKSQKNKIEQKRIQTLLRSLPAP